MRRNVLVLLMLLTSVLLAACGGETPTATPAADAPAATDTASGTSGGLDAIKKRGKLVAGVKYDVPLFGFLNPETNVIEGLDADLARAIAKQIFGDENAVEFREAVSANRIPYLQEGTVDVVISTMTANAERAEQIGFSDAYYVAGQSLLVPINSEITDINGLAGKTIGTVTGSTSEKNIRKLVPDANVELYATYSEAVLAMQSGRADAVTTDDIILYGFARKNPELFKVVGGQFTQEPYAVGVQKGNTDLLNEVNTTIRTMKENGGWADLYRKWISDEVPATPPQDWQTVYDNAPKAP